MATIGQQSVRSSDAASVELLGRLIFGVSALILFLALLAPAEQWLWDPAVSAAIASVLLVLHIALSFRRLSTFDPLVWLPIAMLLFYFGRAIIIGWFRLVPEGGYDPWSSGTLAFVPRAYAASLLSLTALLFGIYLAGVRSMNAPRLDAQSDPVFDVAAVLFAILSVSMVLVGIAIVGPRTLFGYYDMWWAAKTGGVDQRFIDIGIPFAQVGACALIASGARRTALVRWFAYFLFAFTCAIAIGKGDRTNVVALGVGAGWVFSQRIRRVPASAVIALALTSMIVIPIIGEWRASRRMSDRNTSLPELVSRTMGEMGMSASALTYCLKVVPEEKSFEWGSTFWAAAVKSIPNIGITKRDRLGGMPIARSPSDWLAWRLAPDYWAAGGGFGFSMVGEWYYNFGIPGIYLGTMLVGFAVARARNAAHSSPLALVWSTTLFAAAAIWVRNSVGYPLRVALWPIVALWLIQSAVRALGPRAR